MAISDNILSKYKDIVAQIENIQNNSDSNNEIILIKKRIKILKSEINIEIAQIKSHFINSKNKIGTGINSGLIRGFFGSRFSGKINQFDRQNIRERQLNYLQPYINLKLSLDEIDIQLSSIKLLLGDLNNFQNNNLSQNQSILVNQDTFNSKEYQIKNQIVLQIKI